MNHYVSPPPQYKINNKKQTTLTLISRQPGDVTDDVMYDITVDGCLSDNLIGLSDHLWSGFRSKSVSRIRALTCPLSWRPAGQSRLVDETVSEFVLRPAERHTVTRLTLQKLQEVFELPTPLKTQRGHVV